jgi:small conductance mechanosensitive channel
MAEFDALLPAFELWWRDLVLLLPRLVIAALVFAFAYWLGRRLGALVTLALKSQVFLPTHRRFFGNLATWLVTFVGLAVSLNLLGLQVLATGLLAGSSITAIILGFAFREIGENFLAGFFLAFGRPFRVGDLIECVGFQGVVRGIDLRTTHIRTADGRDVFIPNAKIFNQPLINFTRDGFRRLSFDLGIDYGEDIKAAQVLLQRAAQGTEEVLDDPPLGVVVKALAENAVELTVYFWVDMFAKGRAVGEVQSEVMNRCREALLSHGFTLSADTRSNLSLEAPEGLRVRLEKRS